MAGGKRWLTPREVEVTGRVLHTDRNTNIFFEGSIFLDKFFFSFFLADSEVSFCR